MISDKICQDVEDGLAKAENGRKRRPGVRAWQQEKKKSRSRVDPFSMLVFLYLIFSVSCLLWFGWKYYTLKREVARLSEIIVTLFEEKATEPTVNLPDQKEPDNNNLPNGATTASPLPAKSTLYTIKEGDSWWKISENFYGVGNYYLKLPAYNKISNQRIYKGLVVEIPPKEVLDAFQ